ncbi:hypothetical protein [Streptomyces bluensis]|uniref:hypothetical protein n=1 Tax=Streptomyces bluensis TaxID=33897 RepID=UPI0016757985|nr:hypothetical protein [Streptomyces bluensis]GGZ83878.1 hypothetical protein GCM10010344_58820 [Streptomyces bluensis]
MKHLKRFALVGGTAAAATLLTATNAFATWSSSIAGARPGFASREWGDQSYTQIHFNRCHTGDFPGTKSVDVQLVRVDTFPDTYYDTKRFTECFTLGDGDETSTGVWTGLPAGDYQFYIKMINNSDISSSWVSVEKVTVDTTQAD